MTIYNADNVKITVCGVELKGCGHIKLIPEVIEIVEIEMDEQWEPLRFMRCTFEPDHKTRCFLGGNRAPRGMRVYK